VKVRDNLQLANLISWLIICHTTSNFGRYAVTFIVAKPTS